LPPSIALAGQVDVAAPHMLALDWAPLVGAAVMTKKSWDTIPLEGRDAVRKAATEAGKLLKADGRRESAESVEAMRKRGLRVHAVPRKSRPSGGGSGSGVSQDPRGDCSGDMFDEVVKQLNAYRAAQAGDKK
jgi:hypothetical protein